MAQVDPADPADRKAPVVQKALAKQRALAKRKVPGERKHLEGPVDPEEPREGAVFRCLPR